MADEKIEAVNAILRAGGSKVSLMSGYGMTELVSAATATYENCCSKGSVGIPLVKTNCRIVDLEDGTEKMYGEEGEICFSGPTVMKEYYRMPDDTSEMIKTHPDGSRWLHTGDVGYISSDGEVFITGRIKRIFLTKGDDGIVTKMFPDRIEKAILMVEGIEECVVVEKPDASRVNVPYAFVKTAEGCAFDKTALFDHLKGVLPAYMVPVEIIRVDDIPKTSRGKADYRKVKETFLF